jgi:hypothetical protein
MGRKSHNKTYEEVLEDKRIHAIEYYRKNRDAINEKRRSLCEKLKNSTIQKNNR